MWWIRSRKQYEQDAEEKMDESKKKKKKRITL
jgi:hypothetical protein